jgi:hypothetical protein
VSVTAAAADTLPVDIIAAMVCSSLYTSSLSHLYGGVSLLSTQVACGRLQFCCHPLPRHARLAPQSDLIKLL